MEHGMSPVNYQPPMSQSEVKPQFDFSIFRNDQAESSITLEEIQADAKQ